MIMIKAVTLGFPKILRGICSASCWLLVLLCAAAGTIGCAEEKQQAISVQPGPTTAEAESLTIDKAALDFCNKSKTPAVKKDKDIAHSVQPRYIFVSSAPWALLAPPHDYPGDFSSSILPAKVETKPDTEKSAKAPAKEIVKQVPKIDPATEKKPDPSEQAQPLVVELPRKKFISTAPWTRLAPPTDYESDDSRSRIADGIVVWQPKHGNITEPVATGSDKKKPQTTAKSEKIAAKKPIKKTRKSRVVKKKKPKVVIVKKSPKDWTWPSEARLESQSRCGKKFPATTPWALIAPVSDQTARLDMRTTTAKLPSLPNPDQRIMCELRVVRVSDGLVVSSASAIATFSNIKRLARTLVGEFGRDGNIPIGAGVIVVSLSNREGTDQGLLLSEKMTEHVVAALKRASKFKFLKQLDLRDTFPEEPLLESSKAITAKLLNKLMQNGKYVLVGGISIQHPLPVSLPTESDSGSLAKNTSYYDN